MRMTRNDKHVVRTVEKIRNRMMCRKKNGANSDGGEGSGNFGHAGRPGEVGGSSQNGETKLTADERNQLKQKLKDYTKQIYPMLTKYVKGMRDAEGYAFHEKNLRELKEKNENKLKTAKDRLKKAKTEYKKVSSGRDIDDVFSDYRRLGEEVRELYKESERKGNPPELVRNIENKIKSQSALEKQIDAYVEIEATQREIERCEKELKSADKELRDFEKSGVQEPWKKLNAEYEKIANERDEIVRRLYPTVDECDDVAAVGDYLRAKNYFDQAFGKINADLRIKFKDIDLDNAKDVVKRIDKLAEEYPEEIKYCRGIYPHNSFEDMYAAFAKNTRMLVLNTGIYNKAGELEETYKDVAKRRPNFHPEGVSHTSIIDHELAHAFEFSLENRLSLNGETEKPSDTIMKRVCERLYGRYDKSMEPAVRRQVSDYASRNHGVRDNDDGSVSENHEYGVNREWFAEAMSEATNSSNPRGIAKIVKEEFDAMLKRSK